MTVDGTRARLQARPGSLPPYYPHFWCGGRYGSRRRCQRGRLRGLRRLLTARDALEPFDLLEVRYEHGFGWVFGELRADRVCLRGEERELLTAIEVCSLDAVQERAHLVGHGLPADRFVLQLTDVIERLPDGVRDVVEEA